MVKRGNGRVAARIAGEFEIRDAEIRQKLTSQQILGATLRARGVVVSHPLSMREALGSIPSVSTVRCMVTV